MCVVSMVYDYYKPTFPDTSWPWPAPDTVPRPKAHPIAQPTPIMPTKAEMDRLEKLIKDFREAEAAAKRVDELTSQKDCVDPEKAKLLERVAALEEQLALLKKERRQKAKKKAKKKAKR